MSRTMRAVVLDESGLHVCAEAQRPTPQPGEVIVRVSRAGICETDVQLVRGYMGFRGVLGHEFVGVAQSGRFAGQRVVAEINNACRTCPTCLAGLPNHCPHRTVTGILNHAGGFAEEVAVPEVNLHAIPDTVTDDMAVFIEPLAAAFQIPAQIPDLAGQRVIVLGDGRLGQLCAQVLALHGTRLTVIGKHVDKLERLRIRGIDTALRGDIEPDRSADIVVDCTGSATGIEDAFRWLRPRGTLVLKTTVAGQPPLSLAPIVIDELRVIGSRCGPFPPAIQALAEGTVDVEPLISARYPLSDAIRAFEHVTTQPVLKVLLEIVSPRK
jgi:threonine dehydrogenase-like Zn-dependent dehydrogenase